MKRNFYLFIYVALVVIFMQGCSSTPKPYEARPAKKSTPAMKVSKGSSALVAQPLTSEGNNFRPVFSADGKKLLYVSENREGHRGLQVYEIDLATRVEKRLTFQDGDVESVVPANDGERLFYASSTDEIKEEPHFLGNLVKRLNRSAEEAVASRIPGTLEEREPGPFELYEASRDGSRIRRITRSTGFDGDLALGNKGRTLVFSSSKNKQRDLYVMNLADGSIRRLTSEPLRDVTPSMSADGSAVAWARLSEGLTSSQIMIADTSLMTAKPLTSYSGMNSAPAWHPNGQELVFASDRSGSKDDVKTFDLYEVNESGACMKRLTESESDELFPAFSPDGRQVAFTSNNSGSYQIYLMEHRPPASCLDQAP